MLKLKSPVFGTDQYGHEVFMSRGDSVSEISDAGPVEEHSKERTIPFGVTRVTGWNVACRFTPSHKLWTEIVTIDAVKLLKALEGVE